MYVARYTILEMMLLSLVRYVYMYIADIQLTKGFTVGNH